VAQPRHAALLAVSLLCAAPDAGGAPAADAAPARVLRYVSWLPEWAGQACHGLVLSAPEGIPETVLNLATRDATLCAAAGEPESVERLRRALEVGARAPDGGAAGADGVERLEAGDLAARVLPPVVITRAQLDARTRVVIGAGLNYPLHREEVGLDPDALLLFPKPVPPTAAYAPLPRGARIGTWPAQPVVLLDYEVELGFVLLEDFDLGAPLPPREAFLRRVAFFTANDVSDREPIMHDPDTGYARGKSRPGYLPIGPWLVRGDALDPASGGEGRRDLTLSVTVRETDGTDTVRQAERSASMIHGPRAILAELAARWRRGAAPCMRDDGGVPRHLHDARGVVPAGSIVLTGTPGGTAVNAPDLLERLRLFVLGGFSVDGARARFVAENRGDAPRLGYLEPGERVDTRVLGLGRQRWTVAPGLPDAVHGLDGPGACGPPGASG
jgi:2-keto-4-pentenoate hydratase/2-oxohepta-3-ene-1,7-dioic acid hydratase in catechol pathway